MDNFKTFLTEAQKSDYVSGGEMMLFHHAPVHAYTIVLHPQSF